MSPLALSGTVVVDVQATAADNRASDFLVTDMISSYPRASVPTLAIATSHARHMVPATCALLPDDVLVTRAEAFLEAWLPTVHEASKC